MLWVHPGTEHPTKLHDQGEPYAESAFVPVFERRKLTITELEAISSQWHWPGSTCIASFSIKDDVVHEMHLSSNHDFDLATQEETKALGQRLWTSICDSSPIFSLGETRWLGFSRRPSGLRTSTFDVSTGLRIGLHLDSWDRIALSERNFTRNRLCINLGARSRSLLFLPSDVRSIIHSLTNDSTVHSANIGERFCRRFPEAAVLELEVPPGHAYLAPTENIIHDGHSEVSPSPDTTIAWLGHISYFGGFR